ncbi:MAG: hypothetical protein GX154_06065 [Clostridiales bacterium]|nr:hypothetical protein [Clostridiales bacterium]
MDGILKALIKWAASIAVLLFAFLELGLNEGHSRDNLSFSVSITFFLMTAYVFCLWKYNPFLKIPKLKKIYQGSLESSFNNVNKDCTVTIKQTLLKTQIRLTTNETQSHSIASRIVKENGDFYLYYIYRSEPKMSVRNENPISYGATKLHIKDKSLTGNYWTDGGYKGDINLRSLD